MFHETDDTTSHGNNSNDEKVKLHDRRRAPMHAQGKTQLFLLITIEIKEQRRRRYFATL